MITFGRKLKHLRQKNHLTQKELGIAMGECGINKAGTGFQNPAPALLIEIFSSVS